MPPDPGVTVLTPNFNYGRYVGDAVRSVVGLSAGWEQIVVDAASTDDSLTVIASVASGPRTVISEPDRGQSDALNKGLRVATGGWIGWLNSDEFYLPNAATVVDRVLAAHSDVDVVHGDVVLVDEHGRFAGLERQHGLSRFVLAHYGTLIRSSSVFIRREILGEDPWDLELRSYMDRDLYLRLVTSGARSHYVPVPLSCYRIHGEQVTLTLTPRAQAEGELLTKRYTNGRLPRTLHTAARAWHVALKAARRGFGINRSARDLLGRDMRWFESAEADAAVRSFCERYEGRTRR
jgi:glycosyltransferase involved in cell wall biosynthesis